LSENNLIQTSLSSLDSNKAQNILNLDIKKISTYADNIIIASATSSRHAKSLLDKLVLDIKSKDIDIIGIEGKAESGWVLIDCGDLVIHIMQQDVREFYDLEGLWGGDTLVESRT
jgi:ribosome-associated protein